jgi:citrate lyase beta subunit
LHTLTLWTNDARRAAWADAAGVDRIGLDLETLGKSDRQKGLPTWISQHALDDLERIRPSIDKATLFVRSNPLHEGSASEIEALLARRVAVIMLPNFTRASEVEAFLGLVRGRARVVPLVERLAALDDIGSLPELGIEEVHVGLNDLSIDLGERNRLAVLGLPVMNRLSEATRRAGLKLGLGGLARVLDDTLPVPSDLVYAQHARLGATGALIARSFFTADMTEARFAAEIARMRTRLAEWSSAPAGELEKARAELVRCAQALP